MESDSQPENEKLVKRLDSNDAAADRRGRKKNKVVRHVRDIMQDPKTTTEQIIEVLSKGTTLHKVRSLDKFYFRKFFVDLENMRIHYGPSIKNYMCREVPYHDLCDLAEVRKGWESDRFNVIESRLRRKLHASIGPKNLPTLAEDNCFSLVFDNGTETEDLVAADHHVRDLWVKGLSHLIATSKNQQRENEYQYWLREQFRKADKNKNGNLSLDELMVLLNQVNISMNKKHAKALYDKIKSLKTRLLSSSSDNGLDQDEFLKFYEMLNARPELDKIFYKYSVNNTRIMGPEELMHFLKTEQNMSRITLADCEAYIKRFEPKESDVPGYMSLKGFRNLFTCVDFDIFNKSHRIVCQDMSQPLSHYIVASSHNTYLMKDQLIGSSSIEAYRMALIRGCRCIELDVWDGEDGEPIIYHGYTLTSKIHLRDVLKTIHKYAFRKSQYPLILSMENHCSEEQQVVMASLMKEHLEDYLYTTPVDKNEKHWPSPESLARKILIKGKKLPPLRGHLRVKRKVQPMGPLSDYKVEGGDEKQGEFDEESDEYHEENGSIDTMPLDSEDGEDEVDGVEHPLEEKEESDGNQSDDEFEEENEKENEEQLDVKIRKASEEDIEDLEESDGVEVPDDDHQTLAYSASVPIRKKLSYHKSISSDTTHQALGVSTSAPVRQISGYDPKESKKMKLAKEFSDLVNYCVSKKFVSFHDCFKKWKFYEMVSFVETKSEELSEKMGNDYVKFTKKYLARIYPKGTRTDSSNYNPIPHWNSGAQLVALNYQTTDKPMLFNESLFSLNGGCGYVLKAEYLRRGVQYGTSVRSSVLNSPSGKPKRVTIRIISGQHIPKPGNSLVGEVIDPYVKLQVYGHPADKSKFSTKPVRNNGFNPIWDEKFEFLVRLPEMAFLYFAVKDQSTKGPNALLGQYMLAFPAIMEGYRHIRLLCKDNQPLIPASIFVNVSFKDVGDYWSPE